MHESPEPVEDLDSSVDEDKLGITLYSFHYT